MDGVSASSALFSFPLLSLHVGMLSILCFDESEFVA